LCSARDETSGERVAVKVMDAEIAKNTTAVARFVREARAASASPSTPSIDVLLRDRKN
jgi:hypothetical protein